MIEQIYRGEIMKTHINKIRNVAQFESELKKEDHSEMNDPNIVRLGQG